LSLPDLLGHERLESEDQYLGNLLTRAKAYGARRRRRSALAGGALAVLLAAGLSGVLLSVPSTTQVRAALAQRQPAHTNSPSRNPGATSETRTSVTTTVYQGPGALTSAFAHGQTGQWFYQQAPLNSPANALMAPSASATSSPLVLWREGGLSITAQVFTHRQATVSLKPASNQGTSQRMVSCRYGESVEFLVQADANTRSSSGIEGFVFLPLVANQAKVSTKANRTSPYGHARAQPIYLVYAHELSSPKNTMILIVETSPRARYIRVSSQTAHRVIQDVLETPTTQGLVALSTEAFQNHDSNLLVQAIGKSGRIIATVRLSPSMEMLADPNCP